MISDYRKSPLIESLIYQVFRKSCLLAYDMLLYIIKNVKKHLKKGDLKCYS